MTRVKRGTVAKTRRRKVLKQAKGYFGSKHRLYRTAQEQLFNSGAYSYRDRKKRLSDFRKLWITRINAACRQNDIVYSRFINGLKKANININRKMLSELAIYAPEEFKKLVDLSKQALDGKIKVEKDVEKKIEKIVEEKTDYSKLTVAELKELCKEREIEINSSMRKADLVNLLK